MQRITNVDDREWSLPGAEEIDAIFDEHCRAGIDVRLRTFASQRVVMRAAAAALVATLQRGGKILLFGNGGSAADCQHLAAEFVGKFTHDRAPLPAQALTTDTSALTAIGNDFGFEQVFARQIRAVARPGDAAIGISTSGESANVVLGVRTARECGLETIGLSGAAGGRLAREVDYAIRVESDVTALIQEVHISVGHALCLIVEASLKNPASVETVRV